MQDQVLDAVKDAVMEIVTTMLFIEVEPAHGLVKPSGVAHVAARADASAMVGLNGGLNGGVRIACSEYVALLLASSLMGETIPKMDADAKDGFAEIGNMIAGGIQTRLMSHVGEINLTPPTVIVGGDFEVDYKSNLESVRQFFRVEEEAFYIEVHFLQETKIPLSLSLERSTVDLLDDLVRKLQRGRSKVVQKLILEYTRDGEEDETDSAESAE
ncbi:MAG: chemotaxis protein CheX [Magnetococcales bacterium]|nr:chemotaxis protein CheX [Magnetococcales bacterium]